MKRSIVHMFVRGGGIIGKFWNQPSMHGKVLSRGRGVGTVMSSSCMGKG